MDFETDMDGGAEDPEMEALKLQLQLLVDNKRKNATLKQAAILREVQASVMGQSTTLEESMGKEMKEVDKTCRASLNKLNVRMTSKLQDIEALSASYTANMEKLWGEYNETYNELHATRADLRGKVEKRKVTLKGRISTLQQEVAAQLLDAGKLIEKHQQSASKLPGIAKALEAMM